MKVGIPKEIYPYERRVAAVPETVHKILKLGYQVVIEAGAGDAAAFTDATYAEAGASVVPNAATLYAEADIVLKVRQPIASIESTAGALWVWITFTITLEISRSGNSVRSMDRSWS